MWTARLCLLLVSLSTLAQADAPDGATPTDLSVAQVFTRLAWFENETYRAKGSYIASLGELQKLAAIRNLSSKGELKIKGAKYRLHLTGDGASFLIVSSNKGGLRNFCIGSGLDTLRYSDGDVSQCLEEKRFQPAYLCAADGHSQWCRDNLPPRPVASSLPKAATTNPFNSQTSAIGQAANARAQVGNGVEILSDTQGVDFGPYLERAIYIVKRNWYTAIPADAMPPKLEQGKVTIELVIGKDGGIIGMRLVERSQNILLDHAAWSGVTASNPFLPLPREFTGDYLRLRIHFVYNQPKQ
jgi:hypothetical protein